MYSVTVFFSFGAFLVARARTEDDDVYGNSVFGLAWPGRSFLLYIPVDKTCPLPCRPLIDLLLYLCCCGHPDRTIVLFSSMLIFCTPRFQEHA